MKPYTKELIGYAIAAFLIGGIPVMLGVVMFTKIAVNRQTVFPLLLGAILFSTLMTLCRILTDRRKK